MILCIKLSNCMNIKAVAVALLTSLYKTSTKR